MPDSHRMTDAADPSAHLEEFLGGLLRPDPDWAVNRVAGLRAAGASVPQIVSDLLAPAMAEIGRRWHTAVSTVADEHAATAVVDAALAVAQSPHYAPAIPRNGTSLVLTCAEGEWHSLPARMASEVLRSAGVEVIFLGASQPVSSLSSFLSGRRPTALAVSCTLPTNLLGAARGISAGHEAGLPVIVGGQAWGPDSRRADALGADAHVTSISDAAPILRRWFQQPPALRPSPAPDPESLRVEMSADLIAEAAHQRLLERLPELQRMTAAQHQHTRADFGHILRFAAAANLVGDPRLLSEFSDWLLEVLTARGVNAGAVGESYAVLAEMVQDELPSIGALLREDLARIRVGGADERSGEMREGAGGRGSVTS